MPVLSPVATNILLESAEGTEWSYNVSYDQSLRKNVLPDVMIEPATVRIPSTLINILSKHDLNNPSIIDSTK